MHKSGKDSMEKEWDRSIKNNNINNYLIFKMEVIIL